MQARAGEIGRGRRISWSGVISAEGATIERARTFGFDSAADGITDETAGRVRFRSQTTGDTDGIDLWLDQTERGSIVFESPVGRCRANLRELTPERSWSFDGIDVRVSFQRYPEQVTESELRISRVLRPPAGRSTPYLAKVTQVDGHMAWSSPVFVSRRGSDSRSRPG